MSPTGPQNRFGDDPDAEATENEFSVSIGDDLIAEALAAVERRAEESRQARALDDAADAEADEPLDIVFDDGPDDDFDGDEDDALDLGDLDDLLASTGSESDDDGLATDSDGLHDQLQAAQEALEIAEQALFDAEGERDEALKGRTKARRSARKYKAALEQEAQQRQRLGSTQRMLRERLSRTEERLEESESERQTLVTGLQTVTAELEQARRDVQRLRDREEQVRSAARHKSTEKLCKELLPVLDNLELALRHAEAAPDKVVSGVEMVANQFTHALQTVGLERVEAQTGTPFDPMHHEAMQIDESEDHAPNTIIRELRAGFAFEGRLLRAARVIVAGAPAPADDESLDDLLDEAETLTAFDDHRSTSTPDEAPLSDTAPLSIDTGLDEAPPPGLPDDLSDSEDPYEDLPSTPPDASNPESDV